MGRITVDFHDLSFTYETMSSSLFRDLYLSFPKGWTGVIGPNGVGKTTLLRLAVEELEHHFRRGMFSSSWRRWLGSAVVAPLLS